MNPCTGASSALNTMDVESYPPETFASPARRQQSAEPLRIGTHRNVQTGRTQLSGHTPIRYSPGTTEHRLQRSAGRGKYVGTPPAIDHSSKGQRAIYRQWVLDGSIQHSTGGKLVYIQSCAPLREHTVAVAAPYCVVSVNCTGRSPGVSSSGVNMNQPCCELEKVMLV